MELYIQEEQISVHLQKRLERFRADYPVADEVKRRVSTGYALLRKRDS